MEKRLIVNALLIVLSLTVLNAQEKQTKFFADTLHISVDEDFSIMILSENISKYQPADTLNRLLATLNEDLMNIELPDLENRYTQIYYNVGPDGNTLLKFVDVTDEDKIYMVLENGNISPPMPIQLIMNQGNGTELRCMVSNIDYLDLLPGYNISSLIKDVLSKQKEKTPGIRRVAMSTTWKVENGIAADSYATNYRNTNIHDQISLSGTVGASLIRNQLVPSFDFVVGVTLANKTRIKHMIRADFSMNYIFNEKPEGGFSTNINTFVGASYFINAFRDSDKPNWYGVGVSYLAWRNGDFFDENTWRVSFGAKFGDRYSIMPELYFGNNFKNVMPGLKFSIWF